MTDVRLYRMESLGYSTNDLNPELNIGRMILGFDMNFGDRDLIICGDYREPIVMRVEHELYDFSRFPWERPLLGMVPTESCLSKLIDKETIPIEAVDIAEYAEIHGMPLGTHAAEKLIESKLKDNEKDVGVFLNDKDELIAIILGPYGGDDSETYKGKKM